MNQLEIERVAIALYESTRRHGGLATLLLPTWRDAEESVREKFQAYARDAITELDYLRVADGAV